MHYAKEIEVSMFLKEYQNLRYIWANFLAILVEKKIRYHVKERLRDAERYFSSYVR